jgi:hypothetical protein
VAIKASEPLDEMKDMNIVDTEAPETIIAKTCGSGEKNRKVTYSFVDYSHGLCLDKKGHNISRIRSMPETFEICYGCC